MKSHLFFLLASFFLILSSVAQEESSATPETIAPDDLPAAELTPATPALPGTSRDPSANPAFEEKISVNFPDTSITQILLNYERLTNKRLIKDANLAGQNISIVVAEPVTKREAITIIEATLLLNNYALVPFGETQMKVLNITNGKNPRSEGLAIYTTPGSLPEGDQVVSYFMTFKYRDAQQASAELQQSIQPHPYGFFVPVPNAQALLVTETTSVIRRLIELKELIDVPPARIVSEFVSLVRADAERVAETITKMIEAQKANAGQTPGAVAGGGGNVPPPNPDGQPPQQPVFASNNLESSSNNLTSGQVQLVPDTRTNRILVISRPSSFPYVKSLIQEFDRSVGLTEPLEVPLRYLKPSEVLPILADLLAEDEQDASSGGNAGNIQPPAQPRQTRSNNNNSRDGGSGGGLSRGDSLDAPEENLGPESQIVGKTRIVADNRAGKIIVIGPPESLDKVRNILQRLDQKPQQVYLSTVIGQLRIGKNDQFGVDYLQSFLNQGSKGIGLTGTTTGRTSLLDPEELAQIGVTSVASGLNLYGTLANNLQIYVRALESTNRFKILSRPVVYASNNEKATISSGRRIAIPRETLSDNSNSTTTAVRSSIDFEEVVLKLEVIPQINSSQEVTMKIAQINDSVVGNQIISGESVPTIGTQEILTTVTVANRNVVVLGGLITESTNDDRSKIPILGDIPYLGAIFRNTSKNKERNELLIFIQPNVVGSEEDTQFQSLTEESRGEVGLESRSWAEGKPQSTPIPLKIYRKN